MDVQKWCLLSGNSNNRLLFIGVPPILLIIIVTSLLMITASICSKFTKGPLSTVALLQRMRLLQAKFIAGKEIDPETEREEMEILQNKIKTSSSMQTISGNSDLKQLFARNCASIQSVLKQPVLDNKTSWIKFNALMADFNTSYFEK